jgi:pyruvate dehydrogenase E1 component alpha subunit
MTLLESRTDLSREQLLWMYERMGLIREFEERLKLLVERGLPVGATHYYVGEEAVAVGVCAALQPSDWIASTHRGHGHCIAKGVDVGPMMAELFGKAGGTNRGKGGSMHITDLSKGMLGVNPILGMGAPHAVGAAITARVKGTDQVAVTFFGDGAASIGAIHESMNMAAIWKLPVIFVCENNLYMEYTPIASVTAVEHPAADRASAYGLPKIVIDGNDADAVYRTARDAYDKARAGGGPSLIECMTYRHSGHSRADPAKYRPEGELEKWKERDPIKMYRERLAQFGIADDVIAGLETDVRRVVDEATEACKAAPMPPLDILTTDVYADGGFAWRN